MYSLGIVGSEAAKFTPETEARARVLIRNLLTIPGVTSVVSGACHLGGIDAWAAEIGRELGLYVVEYAPARLSWTHYKARNIRIAEQSDEVHCITLAKLPEDYAGMRFKLCYHCGVSTHVKSGGCWTMLRARAMGKAGVLHVI